MRFIFLFITNTIVSILILKYIYPPFIWISFLWFFVFIYATIVEKKQTFKLVWFNIGFLVILLGTVETYLWIRANETKPSYEVGYIIFDDVLGYAPSKGRVISSSKYHGADIIYNVTYTINPNGLRLSSPKGNQNNECVLFFGGSFTFGEGVNDNETMPYLVGTESNHSVYNFGFHGYGPHQMLAALEQGVVKKNIMECQPKFAIYQGAIFHVERAAGYTTWDRNGPQFVLLSDGTVSFKGHFNDDIRKKLINQSNKSFIFKRFFANRKSVSKSDIDLFIGIVKASKKIFIKHNPESTFEVIFWDITHDENEMRALNGLKAEGIQIHLISDILPDYLEDPSKYKISPYDGHPNSLAHKLIAEYVVANILSKSDTSTQLYRLTATQIFTPTAK